MSSVLKEIAGYDPGLQKFDAELENAVTLKSLVLTCFKIGMAVAVLIIEEVLRERAYNMAGRPVCPVCGTPLESKGWLPRTLMTVTWKRKVWRCPKGCKTGQTDPFDSVLGLKPNQRTGNEVKQIACIPAVFLPFNIAALLLKILLGTEVSPTSIRNWVQCAGGEAMARLEKELTELKNRLPVIDGIEAEIAILPLLIGGDGVMVPFRPDGGSLKRKVYGKK